MKGETLFISDLHLDASRPDATSLFQQFLERDARAADALYILGDLFEVWIGDDDPDEHHRRVINAIHALSASGTAVYLMHGNRDFLMGERFSAEAGVILLADPTIADLYGTPTLLMHGDTLCSDDSEYMEFRELVRSSAWQQDFLSRSLDERQRIVKGLREESQKQTRQKAQEIMDVTQATVEAVMRTHHCQQLIHGHTHRPAIHEFSLDGKPARRIVLGDWYEQGSVLRCTPPACRLEELHMAK